MEGQLAHEFRPTFEVSERKCAKNTLAIIRELEKSIHVHYQLLFPEILIQGTKSFICTAKMWNILMNFLTKTLLRIPEGAIDADWFGKLHPQFSCPDDKSSKEKGRGSEAKISTKRGWKCARTEKRNVWT